MEIKSRLFTNLGIAVILSVIFTSCFDVEDSEQSVADELNKLNQYITGLESEGHDVDTTAMGTYYITLEEGVGDYPALGDTVEVSYTGYLIDGSLFDSSMRSATDTTFTFEIGNENYISGWNDGLRVIKQNGKTQLMIPSSLAYGETGYGSIPPNNTLIFVVRMVDIKRQ